MNQNDQELLLDTLLNDRNADPKKLHKEAAKLTRRKILRAAMECFASHGYHSTTIRQIASQADVTMGAVYHHFQNKKELLMQMNRQRQIVSLEIMQEALDAGEDFFTGLRNALRQLFSFLSENPVLRGITREYWGMAMVDPDLKEMHHLNDVEFRELYGNALKRHYPQLSAEQHFALVHMFLVAFEGLITAVVVESPMAVRPEQILDSFIDAFRKVVGDQDHSAA